MCYFMCFQERFAESYLTIAIVIFSPPTLCKVIFHLWSIIMQSILTVTGRAHLGRIQFGSTHRHRLYTHTPSCQFIFSYVTLQPISYMTQHWLIGGLFVLLLCLRGSADSHLPVVAISSHPPCSLICVMLALAREESLRHHSANPCQANR